MNEKIISLQKYMNEFLLKLEIYKAELITLSMLQ